MIWLLQQARICREEKVRGERGYSSFQRPPSAATSLSLACSPPLTLSLSPSLSLSNVAAAARPLSLLHSASEALGGRTDKRRWRYRIWYQKEGGMLRWFPSFLSRHPPPHHHHHHSSSSLQSRNRIKTHHCSVSHFFFNPLFFSTHLWTRLVGLVFLPLRSSG